MGECPHRACAVKRRRCSVGVNATQQLLLQPEAILDLPQWATKDRSPSVNEGPLSSEEEPFADSERTTLVYCDLNAEVQ